MDSALLEVGLGPCPRTGRALAARSAMLASRAMKRVALLLFLLAPASTAHAALPGAENPGVDFAFDAAVARPGTLKIRSGHVNADGKGTLRLKGRLRVTKGRASNDLTEVVVRLRRISVASAKVNGGKRRKRVFTLTPGTVAVNGAGTVTSDVTVTLARALSGLEKGTRLGTLTVRSAPKVASISGGDTFLTFDPAFSDRLAEAGAIPGGFEGATIEGDSFQFPLRRGRINTTTGAAALDNSGGLSFSRTNTVPIRLTDFQLRTGKNELTAILNQERIVFGVLAGGAAAFADGGITIDGITATLTQDAADKFNAGLETNVFAAGQPFGGFVTRGQVP